MKTAPSAAFAVADKVGFNDKTWSKDAGAPRSNALHLTKPAVYTRYYEKLKTKIQKNVCEDQE